MYLKLVQVCYCKQEKKKVIRYPMYILFKYLLVIRVRVVSIIRAFVLFCIQISRPNLNFLVVSWLKVPRFADMHLDISVRRYLWS